MCKAKIVARETVRSASGRKRNVKNLLVCIYALWNYSWKLKTSEKDSESQNLRKDVTSVALSAFCMLRTEICDLAQSCWELSFLWKTPRFLLCNLHPRVWCFHTIKATVASQSTEALAKRQKTRGWQKLRVVSIAVTPSSYTSWEHDTSLPNFPTWNKFSQDSS